MRHQWIYVAYRWLLAVYAVTYSILTVWVIHEYTLIYFTSWGLHTFTLYQLWSGTSIAVHHMRLNIPYCQKKHSIKKRESISHCDLSSQPAGCWWGLEYNTLKWYDIIHWILFLIAGEANGGLVFLYWLFVFDPRDGVTHWDITTHLLNGLLGWIDVWITRIPVRIYHAIYAVIFSATYIVFSGFYYAAGGGNISDNGTYIYPILNYGDAPARTTGFVFAAAFIYTPVVHLFFYLNYLLREGLIRALIKRDHCKWLLPEEEEQYMLTQ